MEAREPGPLFLFPFFFIFMLLLFKNCVCVGMNVCVYVSQWYLPQLLSLKKKLLNFIYYSFMCMCLCEFMCATCMHVTKGSRKGCGIS